MTPSQYLEFSDIPFYFAGYSALDKYFHVKTREIFHLYTTGSIIDLAKTMDNLEFPKIRNIDARTRHDHQEFHFTCIDDIFSPPVKEISVLNLIYNPYEDKFYDPFSVYPSLREHTITLTPEHAKNETLLLETAILISRYHFELQYEPESRVSNGVLTTPEEQKIALTQILTSPFPWKGLILLEHVGFIEKYWPEIAGLRNIIHSKDYHPEGDVWNHTLETFRYRKTHDLILSLALLLHDIGKPFSKPKEGKRFYNHANIGAKVAVSILRKLNFSSKIINNVRFLVNYHMLPEALPALPLLKTEKIMGSALFPIILEVYRCDLSSTFRGPDRYYRACKTYRHYLRHRNNPFRDLDRKALVRLYVE